MKRQIGIVSGEWLDTDANLDRWEGTDKPLQAWERRVLMAQWAGEAWNRVCSRPHMLQRYWERTGCHLAKSASADRSLLQGARVSTACGHSAGSRGWGVDRPRHLLHRSRVHLCRTGLLHRHHPRHHPSCEGGRCVLATGSNLNHECGIICSRHREQSNFIDWVCSRWSEHIRWQSIEATRSRKERDLAHHAGTRSRKAFPYVLDRVPSEIAFLIYNCM